jgi:hypothetical protein
MGYRTGLRATALVAFATAAATFAFTSSTTIAAEGQPATAEKTERVGAPIALKTFTKKKVRSASAKSTSRKSGKASLAQRAKAGKRAETYASRKTTKPEKADIVAASRKLAPSVANANALFKLDDNASAAPFSALGTSPAATPATGVSANSALEHPMEVAEAAEINDIDKAAWAPKDVPKLNPAILDSRAEIREDDSRWANTSTIGKIFVAIGALLTLGSAVRMFIA